MKEKYNNLEDQLLDNAYNIPIYIKSSSSKESQQGDVYGIIFHPFHKVKAALIQSNNWCEIVPLHLNIKACTVQFTDNTCQLTFYSGRKFYEAPEDTYQLNYNFLSYNHKEDYTKSELTAKKGPLGTRNYLIRAEAIPLTANSSFIHFSYSYQQGFWARLAMNTYLSTLGRNKVGFSIIDTDQSGQPVYVDGVRGVIERNAMRYFFAIRSFLDTESIPQDKRFLKRIHYWFDLTEQYHQQLYELDKKDYLEYKQKEREDQKRVQKTILEESSSCPVNL